MFCIFEVFNPSSLKCLGDQSRRKRILTVDDEPDNTLEYPALSHFEPGASWLIEIATNAQRTFMLVY